MKGTGRLPSGAEGLDQILCGGLLYPSSYLLAGGPGTGKTVLSSQSAFALSRAGHESLFVSVLTEPYSHLIRNLAGLSFFDETAINKQITFVSAFSILESQGLAGLEEMLRLSLPSSNAKLLVLDNIGMLSGYASSLLDYRAFLQKIIALATMSGTTLIASTDRPFSSEATEYGSFDSVIELRMRHFGMRAVRTLELVKARGSFALKGEHVFEITSDGIVTYPRLESGWLGPPPDKVWDETTPWGVEGLLGFTGGGVRRGSLTGIVGPTGAGKTALCLAFAAAGLEAGDEVLYLSHNEGPSGLRDIAGRMGLDLETAADRLQFIWLPPAEAFFERIVGTFLGKLQSGRKLRLIFDGLDATRRLSAHPERFAMVWSLLGAHLRGRGVTTLFTTQEHPGSGPHRCEDIPWSSVENILELQYEVAGGVRRTTIHVIKVRGQEHARVPGVLEISPKGVRVLPLQIDGLQR